MTGLILTINDKNERRIADVTEIWDIPKISSESSLDILGANSLDDAIVGLNIDKKLYKLIYRPYKNLIQDFNAIRKWIDELKDDTGNNIYKGLKYLQFRKEYFKYNNKYPILPNTCLKHVDVIGYETYISDTDISIMPNKYTLFQGEINRNNMLVPIKHVRNFNSSCIFCDSKLHKTHVCNSDFNGQRHNIDIMDCMAAEVCPDFSKFRLNELRYIAYTRAMFMKSITYTFNNTTYGRKYNRKYKRNPISLNLSRKDTINALEQRWRDLAPFRELMNNPPEAEVCSICYDHPLTSHKWSYHFASWIIEKSKYCITTECNHMFCKECWNLHSSVNSKKEQHLVQSDEISEFLWEEISFVSCPMCRQKIYIK